MPSRWFVSKVFVVSASVAAGSYVFLIITKPKKK